MDNHSQLKVRLFGVLTAVTAVLISILAVEWVLRYLDRSVGGSETMDSGFILYDARYGWKLNPGWRGSHVHHDFSVIYEVNSLGFRGDPKSVTADEKVFFLGDSFTFGLGVNEGETFVDLLNSGTASDGVQFSNFGVPGYSTDQQLLLLDEIAGYRPESLVWTVYLGNDLLDNRYPFPLQAEYAKPLFRLESERLVLDNSPVPRQAKSGAYRELSVESAIIGEFELYSPWQNLLKESRLGSRINSLVGIDADALRESMTTRVDEDIRLFLAMIQKGEALLQTTESELSFLLLPGSGYFRDGSVPSVYQNLLEEQLGEALTSRGYQVGLPAESLKRAQSDGKVVYHPNEGHLTPLGHQVVTKYLASENLW